MLSTALRYVKFAVFTGVILGAPVLWPVAPALAQFDEEMQWEESPFDEAMRLGQQALDSWKLDEAEEQFRRALTLVDGEAEEDQTYAAAFVRIYLAQTLDGMHREEDALEVHEQALETMLGPDSYFDDEDKAGMLRYHAHLLMQLGKWDEAEEFTERSCKHADEWYGEGTPWALSFRGPLTDIFMQTQRSDEAIEIHKKLLDSYREAYGRDNPALMSVISAAAFDATVADRNEQSLEWYQWLTDLQRNENNESALTLAWEHYRIAGLQRNVGEYDKAIDSMYRTLDLIEGAQGDESPNLAEAWGSIANIKATSGDLPGALDAVDKGLEIYGDSDVDLGQKVDLLMYRASLLRLLGRDDEADKALDELRDSMGN
ncbi:MAG: tetratricopeptide repeat protein [Phycisphaeraceae bacterium]|nr:tetratricopeptide repeat protein [Phycisphaeraceae bacterium]